MISPIASMMVCTANGIETVKQSPHWTRTSTTIMLGSQVISIGQVPTLMTTRMLQTPITQTTFVQSLKPMAQQNATWKSLGPGCRQRSVCTKVNIFDGRACGS